MIGSTNAVIGVSEPVKAFINVTTPSEEFYNQIVACSYENKDGTKTILGSFSDTGTCTLAVPELATYTITCNGIFTTVEVTEENTAVSVELRLPKAILNFTTGDLDGEVITVTIGESTYTGTFVDNACTITVYEFGTATIVSNSEVITKEVEDGGEYTIDITLRIDFVVDGVVQNGATLDTSCGSFSVVSGKLRFVPTGSTYNNNWVYGLIKISALDNYVGKTLFIEKVRVLKASYDDGSSAYYGVGKSSVKGSDGTVTTFGTSYGTSGTSSGTYTGSVLHTIEITEEMVSGGYFWIGSYIQGNSNYNYQFYKNIWIE